MNASEFVNKIKTLTPTLDSLKTLELPQEYIDKLISSYQLERKRTDFIFNKNSLLELIENYNVENLEIGMVTLNNNIEENETHFYVGKVEVDILTINKITQEIEVFEYDFPDNMLWKCASSTSNFLDALLYSCSFFSKSFIDNEISENSKIILENINEVTKIAGGDEYKDFYMMLLGYFEE